MWLLDPSREYCRSQGSLTSRQIGFSRGALSYRHNNFSAPRLADVDFNAALLMLG